MESRYEWLEIQAEAKALISLALPLMATTMLGYMMNVVDLSMVGHLGATELAAAALGNTVFNTVYYFLLGVASALDTFLSQAFGAGGEAGHSAMRSWTRRGMLSLCLLAVPGSMLLTFTEPFLLHGLGQTEEISHMAGLFVQLNIPGLWFMLLFMVIQKWLQVQDVLLPMVVIGVVANLANIGFNLIFIHLFGFNGCPVATSVSRLFQLAAAAVYLKFYGPSHPVQLHITMSEPDKLPCYSGILQYLILGLPSGVMTAMEAWSFELTTIVVAAFETTADVDAHIIMLNICGFTFLSFPLGIAIGASLRVGSLLGSQNPRAARLTAWLAIFGGASFMGICAVIIMAARGHIARVFTSDTEVVDVVSRFAWCLALMQISDGVQGCAAGALRGMGRQQFVATANLITLMLVGLGLGTTLIAAAKLGLLGAWVGMDTGLAVLSVLLLFALCTSDWDQCVACALKRTEAAAVVTSPIPSDVEHSEMASQGTCVLDKNLKEDKPSDTFHATSTEMNALVFNFSDKLEVDIDERTKLANSEE